METKFKKNEPIIYQNGDRYELGIVKKICTKDNPEEEQDYFVWYHSGDTAARTPEHTMHKITNLYAFEVIRKTIEYERIWNN